LLVGTISTEKSTATISIVSTALSDIMPNANTAFAGADSSLVRIREDTGLLLPEIKCESIPPIGTPFSKAEKKYLVLLVPVNVTLAAII